MNYNNKGIKAKINAITKKDFNILEVIEPYGGDSCFFIVKNFEPPQSNSISSSPFLTFIGLEISDFLKDNIYNQSLDENFNNSLFSFQEKNEEFLYKFSGDYLWIFYSKK